MARGYYQFGFFLHEENTIMYKTSLFFTRSTGCHLASIGVQSQLRTHILLTLV